MKKILILASIAAAAYWMIFFADRAMWLPAVGCIGWMGFVLWANTRTKKRPRVAAQGSDERTKTKIVNFYDTTVSIGTQAWQDTPAGKSLTKVYYLE